MLFKFLALILVLFFIYLIFFKKSRQNNAKKSDKLISEEMLECHTCKTLVSSDDAILSKGKFYCSKECLR